MKNLLKSLRSKIFAGYMLVILILIVVTFWSIYNFNNLSSSINNIMVENYQSITASESMVESIERQDSALLMILNGQVKKGKETFRSNEQDFLKWLTRAEDNITIEGETSTINKISENYLEFVNMFDHFNELDSAEKRDYYNENYLDLFYTIKNQIRDLRSINQETMVEAQQEADSQANRARISTAVISLLALVVALVSGIYLSNLILKPVNELKEAIHRVSQKNFEQKIPVHTDDEIGALAQEFNKMILRLQEYEKMNINKLVAEKEKSEAIVNNISSPLLVTDSENKIVLLNQRARDVFEISRRHEGVHFLEVINNEKLFNIIQESAKTNKIEDNTITVEDKTRDREHYFKVSSNPVTDKEGKIKYNVTLLENITKLKEIDNMKSEFVSTVSHEFRTPLTSMNMGLSMVLEEDVGELNEEQRQLLEAAYEDTERLNQLVDDLLDLSRIESGKIQMELQKTDINNLIEKTISPFQKQAEEKGIRVVKGEIEEDLQAWVDPTKISWIISNLIGNALRYTPEEEGTIEVGARLQGQRIYVHVEDNGVGIPEEYQDKIFEKFVRANNNEDAASGTGLGLAIAREIVEAHNGAIWVESEEGKGSRFEFYIPRYRQLS